MTVLSIAKDYRLQKRAALCALLLLLICNSGCERSPQRVYQGSQRLWVPQYSKWPALNVLIDTENPDVPTLPRMARVHALAARGDTQADLCTLLGNQKFQENLKTFAETPIPAEYASAEREHTKKDLVAAITDLHKSCLMKTDQETLGKKFDAIMKLYEKIVSPSEHPQIVD